MQITGRVQTVEYGQGTVVAFSKKMHVIKFDNDGQ